MNRDKQRVVTGDTEYHNELQTTLELEVGCIVYKEIERERQESKRQNGNAIGLICSINHRHCHAFITKFLRVNKMTLKSTFAPLPPIILFQ